ncbi:MAG TPA: RNase adapter RapZ [Pyrinomonadaceae bacterium]|nr:RNase adapter RapZ [Pyrinomonadaceae bacterium]
MSAKGQAAKKGAAGAAGAAPDVVIITGLSGSGMSSATNAFEDLGYFCVDNLPLTLLPTFARLVQPEDHTRPHIERAALVINIREGLFLREFAARLGELRASGLKVSVLFFEASDDVLVRRFSETRRPHPAEAGDGLLHSIRGERAAMSDIRAHADQVIDTSEHTVHTLRRHLIERFGTDPSGATMRVQVYSFGYKHGCPRDLDLMFDVRHLPNPYFESHLRDLSGHDRRVVEYLAASPEVRETLRRFTELIDYLLPLYRREGKSYVTVGIGCTGGRHRSVMTANSITRHLRRHGYDAVAVHRDVRKVKRARRGAAAGAEKGGPAATKTGARPAKKAGGAAAKKAPAGAAEQARDGAAEKLSGAVRKSVSPAAKRGAPGGGRRRGGGRRDG